MSASTGPGALGEFLRARRARLHPDELELPPAGDRRRVPGLRREELALLAGVSAPYYARLEQGTSRNASPEVLDAIAHALDLDGSERRHLHDLAAAPRDRSSRRRPAPEDGTERLAPALAQLLPALREVPALVLGRRLDVLAWNPLAHALLAGHLEPDLVDRPEQRPNNARSVFLDPHTIELYADWPRKARAVVGHLRMTAGRHPDDPRLATLIGELTMRSPEFARLWADHTVGSCEGSTYPLRHPLVGPIIVSQQTLSPIGVTEQSLVTITTTPGSASEEALGLLRRLTEEPSKV